MCGTEFFDKTSNHSADSAPLKPRFGALWLLAFPKTKMAFEREEISDHWWDSRKYNGAADGDWENCMRSQGTPTLKGPEASLSYVQCFLYLVSSLINVYFSYYMDRLLHTTTHRVYISQCKYRPDYKTACYSSTRSCLCSPFSHCRPRHYSCWAHLVGVSWVISSCDFHLHFSDDYWGWVSFQMSIDHLYVLFGEVPIQVLFKLYSF